MLEKETREDVIFNKSRTTSNYHDNRFKWGEVKQLLKKANIKLIDSDILEVGYTEGWNEGDSSRDSSYDLTVSRTRPETDIEYKTRCEESETRKKRSKVNRFESYKKLRKEFEGVSV